MKRRGIDAGLVLRRMKRLSERKKYGCALFFHAGKLSSVHSEINIQGLHAAMPADGHVAIIISHTGKNEQLAEIEKMLHRGGTKIIVISGNRKGVVGQYATEFLYAAGSEKVEEFWSSKIDI